VKRKAELALFLLGVAAVVTGLAQMYRPLAWIGGGMAMIAAALVYRKTE
jgi:hypothetical protein